MPGLERSERLDQRPEKPATTRQQTEELRAFCTCDARSGATKSCGKTAARPHAAPKVGLCSCLSVVGKSHHTETRTIDTRFQQEMSILISLASRPCGHSTQGKYRERKHRMRLSHFVGRSRRRNSRLSAQFAGKNWRVPGFLCNWLGVCRCS